MAGTKEPIPEQDAAYIFVKEAFFNIRESWEQIRDWLEELGDYSDLGSSEHENSMEITIDDEHACHEFSLAVLAMEIIKLPPEVTKERKDAIIGGIYAELATLDSFEDTPSNHLERMISYLELAEIFQEGSPSSISKEKMLYFFYRNMGLNHKNGWGDIFLASRLEDILSACMGNNWKVFHKNFIPSIEDRRSP